MSEGSQERRDDARPGLRRGQRLGSRFLVERELGRGAMGVVYLALQENLHRHVALKVCSGSTADLARLRREALAVARLNHPHIVQVYDVEDLEGYLTIIFEYLPGGSLRERLSPAGPRLLSGSLRLTDQVAGALESAHRRGIIHRDVKPSNILFDEDGRAKLADFGVALLSGDASPGGGAGVDAPEVEGSGFAGTVRYAAPEQLQGRPLDGRTDLYALAVVLFEQLTGQPPFKGETPTDVARSILSELPPRVSSLSPPWPELDGQARSAFLAEAESFFERALAKSPEDRFPDARGFREGLRGLGVTAGVPLPELPPVSDHLEEPEAEMGLVAPPARGMVATTTLELSFLVLEHVSWRGSVWDRLRNLARSHVSALADRLGDWVLRRRLSLSLAGLRVKGLERELVAVEARARRLRSYSERQRRRAQTWQERGARAVARVDEGRARVAVLREADARDGARQYGDQARSQELRVSALRKDLEGAGGSLAEAQQEYDLAVSRRDRASGQGGGRGLWWRWPARALLMAVVVWVVAQLFAPGGPSSRSRQPSVTLPDSFQALPAMAEARDEHTVTWLTEGDRVLVVGGCDQEGRPVGSTELFDAWSGRFVFGPPLVQARFNHTATLLADGSVLVVGGETKANVADALASAEIIDPDTTSWEVGSLEHARRRHAAVQLLDSSVLVVGGEDETGAVLASVECYVPAERNFVAAPRLRVARRDATVTLLADGSVLVVGGDDQAGRPLASVELLRPGARSWESLGPLLEARYEHTATGLSDGRVLIVGGGGSPKKRLDSIELYDPDQGRSRVVGHLRCARRVHTTTILGSDPRRTILVVGGAPGPEGGRAERIVRCEEVGREVWRVEGGPRLLTPRMNHGGVLVGGKGVLVVGGFGDAGGGKWRVLRSAEFLPFEGLPTNTMPPVPEG